jgi:intracellular sulfur oxidation DsrE/DsrF family protein
VARPAAVEQPRSGAKVVLDCTIDSKAAEVNKAYERAARVLNLYGASGLKAGDVKIALVLHGEATKTVLNEAAYKTRYAVDHNPNLPLIRTLQRSGVEVLVCGQALNNKGFADAEVADGVRIAVSALTAVMNKQADGYSYILIP